MVDLLQRDAAMDLAEVWGGFRWWGGCGAENGWREMGDEEEDEEEKGFDAFGEMNLEG